MTISLRALESADAEIFAGWEHDPLFAAHAGWRTKPTRAESIPWWLQNIAAPNPPLLRLLASDGETAVGYVDLHGTEPGVRELGYAVAPAARWGHGLGTAVAQAGLAHGFGTLGLTRIWAEAVRANVASIRVLEHLGMRQIGDGEPEDFLGEPSRYVRYEMLSSEWNRAAGG